MSTNLTELNCVLILFIYSNITLNLFFQFTRFNAEEIASKVNELRQTLLEKAGLIKPPEPETVKR